ncbi:uncharacterized protein V6R79_012686 [Siganus canaliculatus]
MHMIVILLCALVKQVTSQTDDVSPAKILAHQKTISENSDLYVTCSTFGLKKQSQGYVYLCQDGKVIHEKTQKQDQSDTTFIIQRVGLQHSGNYSCVYSKNPSLSTANNTGLNFIQILVIANFLPADISVTGLSTVSEGDDAEFKCSLSETLKTLGECQLIHAYLTKNESIVQVQAFNVKQMEAVFTMKSTITRDSGHYGCVVLPSKCIQDHEKSLHGNNVVLLNVSNKSPIFYSGIVCFVVISAMMTAGACFWFINSRGGCIVFSKPSPQSPHSYSVTSQQADTQWVEMEEEYQDPQDGRLKLLK